MTYIRRDPFARTELHRSTIKTSAKCDWCGHNQHGRLFQYWTETDGGTRSAHKGLFCNLTCHNSYHGV